MKTMLFIALIMTMVLGVIHETRAETYTCRGEPNKGATCGVDRRSDKDNLIYFHCRSTAGSPAVKKTCSAVYTPIQGYTYTGVPGRNWACDGGLNFLNEEFADKKSVCDRLCGTCQGGWK